MLQKKMLVFSLCILLVGFLFLIHGLGFAYLSFLFSICPIAYLIYRLKRFKQHKREKIIEIIKSRFDAIAYILVLVMIFFFFFPNILFFPFFLINGKIPTVELYSDLENGNPAIEPYSDYYNDKPFFQGFLLKFPAFLEKEIIPTVVLNSNMEDEDIPTVELSSNMEDEDISTVELYSNYFSDKPFLQGFLLKFPVTTMIVIPFSFYNGYSHFVFVFNIIYIIAGILFLFLFPVIIFIKRKIKVDAQGGPLPGICNTSNRRESESS
jgi:hypothetical protein